jgi:hypothetical protein
LGEPPPPGLRSANIAPTVGTVTRLVRRAGLLSLLACALLPSAPAVADPAWLAPQDLSASGQSAANPQVAFDSQGDAVAIWQRSDGANNIVQAATRPAGGAWGSAQDLSVAGQPATTPQVAVNSQGDAVATWLRSDGTNIIVQAATRPAGGPWGPAQDLSAAGNNALRPQVTVDVQGDAVAIWQRFDGANNIVQAAARPAGGVWSPAQDLSLAGQDALFPQVSVDGQGTAVAIWQRFDGANYIVQAATRPAPSGVWQTAQDLSVAGRPAINPQLTVGLEGDVAAVWQRFDGAHQVVQAAIRPSGQAWGAPLTVSAIGQDATNPQVASNGQGSYTAVWARSNGTNTIVQDSAWFPLSPGWQAPHDLSATGQDASNPQVAENAATSATVTWERSNGANLIVQAASRPRGIWFPAVDLSVAGQSALRPQVAVDGQGNAVAAWQRSNGTNTIVQAAGFDLAGPQLRALQVPGGGTAGSPLGFSVQPLDVWSPVASTSWTFGDGGGAEGASVSHTYAAPGTYNVHLTSTDSLGNPDTATAQIKVSPASAPYATSSGDHTAPTVTLALPKQKLPAALKKGLKGSTSSSEAGRVTLTASLGATQARKLKLSKTRKPVVVAKGTVTFSASGKKSVTLRFNAKAARALRKLGKVSLTVQATGKDAAGNVSHAVKRKLTLRR